MRKPLAEMTLEELWQLFPIQLTEHKDYWNDWYCQEEGVLYSFLPKEVKIHHIGSTAINGIWAKPIIDILVEANLKEHERIYHLLLNKGYICMDQDQNSMDFNKGYTPEGFADRVFHLHLRAYGDNRELYFRDYLREHPEVAKDYEALKLSLWKHFEFDRDGYTRMKGEFVKKYTQIAINIYGRDKYLLES